MPITSSLPRTTEEETLGPLKQRIPWSRKKVVRLTTKLKEYMFLCHSDERLSHGDRSTRVTRDFKEMRHVRIGAEDIRLVVPDFGPMI